MLSGNGTHSTQNLGQITNGTDGNDGGETAPMMRTRVMARGTFPSTTDDGDFLRIKGFAGAGLQRKINKK
jgi:hypothetical protein